VVERVAGGGRKVGLDGNGVIIDGGSGGVIASFSRWQQWSRSNCRLIDLVQYFNVLRVKNN